MKKKELIAFLQYSFMVGVPGLAAKELFESGSILIGILLIVYGIWFFIVICNKD